MATCRLCSSAELQPVVDLGMHPLADTFLSPAEMGEPEVRYPLVVDLCASCGYVGLRYVVPPFERYQRHDYSYDSANSKVAVEHFGELAGWLVDKLELKPDQLAVDIGSNVGTLLRAINAAAGCRIVGIEPAANMAAAAARDNVPTVATFFDQAVEQVVAEHGKAAAVTATNVFNHLENLGSTLENLGTLLADGGTFVFEVPYLVDLVKQRAFDTIYLEHISYFSVKPFRGFFVRHGFYISQLERTPYMGGSIRVGITANSTREDAAAVGAALAEEEASGVYDPATYVAFMADVNRMRSNVCGQLYELARRGEPVVGIGAATKGNTLLNYFKIDGSLLKFITDASPHKVGKFTPGSRIPIVDDSAITSDIRHAFILPWNIADFLKEKLQRYNFTYINTSV